MFSFVERDAGASVVESKTDVVLIEDVDSIKCFFNYSICLSNEVSDLALNIRIDIIICDNNHHLLNNLVMKRIYIQTSSFHDLPISVTILYIH